MHPLTRIHRTYVAIKGFVIALGMILFGLAIGTLAVPLFRVGAAFADWSADIASASNIFAIICIVIALGAIGYGVSRIFEALPWITPTRVSNAPGRSRLASRTDLRKSRVI
jgi:hypothetical protein